MKYVALLRGINVGGNKKVPMAELRMLLEGMGFRNVKTLLNSGNVVLDAEKDDDEVVRKRIEEGIEKQWGFYVRVIVWRHEELRQLVEREPFAGIRVERSTRLYVTFLGGKTESSLKLPYESEEGSFRILEADEKVVVSVLEVTKMRSGDAMGILEKEWGKDVTTRNWNTVVKLAGL